MQWTGSELTGVLALWMGAALLWAGDALAGTVSVFQPRCGAEITLVASDAKLSEVLTALADKSGFALRFDLDSERTVSVEMTRTPEKLIESLTRGDNVMVTTRDDPNCVGNTRITEVRFLAAGNPIVVPAHVPQDAPPMATAPLKSVHSKVPKLDQERRKTEKRRRDMTEEERQQDHERRREQRW